jgi:hypothetical protein
LREHYFFQFKKSTQNLQILPELLINHPLIKALAVAIIQEMAGR